MNKLCKILPILGLLTIGLYSCNNQNSQKCLVSAEGKNLKMPYSKMALTAKFIGPAIEDENFFNWCVSPIIGDDNKIHIFGSRWPKKYGMEGWREIDAEIAHFVSDKPEGPFKYVGTVLKSEMFADSLTMRAPHNPRLEYIDGKYVLLYICQNPSEPGDSRIGMMTADNLDGPWSFAGDNNGIMLDDSKDPSHWTYGATIGVCNPAFLKIGDKYCIYFSCVTTTHQKAKHNYGCAVSDNLEGPYTMMDAPVTDNISYIEDAQAFEQDGKYYLLTTDNFGMNTGAFGNLILWESADGLQFKMENAKIAMGTLFDYWATKAEQEELMRTPNLFVRSSSSKLERPAILKVDGKPAYLYAAGGVNLEGGSVSKSYVFKINWDN